MATQDLRTTHSTTEWLERRRRAPRLRLSNALCAQIHNRMPLMLGLEDFAHWLGTPDDRAALLRPEMWP